MACTYEQMSHTSHLKRNHLIPAGSLGHQQNLLAWQNDQKIAVFNVTLGRGCKLKLKCPNVTPLLLAGVPACGPRLLACSFHVNQIFTNYSFNAAMYQHTWLAYPEGSRVKALDTARSIPQQNDAAVPSTRSVPFSWGPLRRCKRSRSSSAKRRSLILKKTHPKKS